MDFHVKEPLSALACKHQILSQIDRRLLYFHDMFHTKESDIDEVINFLKTQNERVIIESLLPTKGHYQKCKWLMMPL